MLPSDLRGGVTGTGLLADALRALDLTGTRVRIEASDAWAVPFVPPADPVPLGGDPVLPVWTELGVVVIGPLERPGVAGCRECARRRRRRAQVDGAAREAVSAASGSRPAPWLTGWAADTVAAVVQQELGPAGPPGPAVSLVSLADLRVTRHPFLPDPLCPVCGDRPDDDAPAAEIVLTRREKPDSETFHEQELVGDLERLEQVYVDPVTGLIREIREDTMGGLVMAAALLPVPGEDEAVEPGVGRTSTFRSARTVAVLEAVERYGGLGPRGRRTVVRAAYAEVSGHALDPSTLGVHPDESYERPAFPFRRFAPDRVTDWVWGYSFARQEPILVPERLAYYHVHPHDPAERPFLYEISNGCALGGSLEEAVLHGLLEVAERDAFLLTWYRQRTVPRLDLDSVPDGRARVLAGLIQDGTGYRVEAFDITTEFGIPSVWVQAVDPQSGTGSGPGPVRPAGVCAAGSSPVPRKALVNALSELGPILVDLIRRYPAAQERARQMVAEPDLVRTMEDHSTLYGHPEAFARLGFLENGPLRPLESMQEAVGTAFGADDLSIDLRALVARFTDAGHDVVVVDQTAPEHRAGGLACAKVLIPGTVPMTFGYRNRRVDGLPRLGREPFGHPHPFP
jgi:ribosomal protein S12 methylthiotransferase accessory factor